MRLSYVVVEPIHSVAALPNPVHILSSLASHL